MSDTTTTETKKAPTKRDAKALFDSFRIEAKPELSEAEAERQRRIEEIGELIAILAESFEKFGAAASAPELVNALKSLQQFSKKAVSAIANQSDAAILADPNEAPAPVTRKPRAKKAQEPALEVGTELEAVLTADAPEAEPEAAPAIDEPEGDSDEVEPMTEGDVLDDVPAALEVDPKASKPEESFEEYAARMQAQREAKPEEETPAPAVATRQVRSGPGTRVAAKVEDNEGF